MELVSCLLICFRVIMTVTQVAEPVSSERGKESAKEVNTDMLKVPAGTFQMGRPYTDEGWPEEVPVHTVQLDAFAIGIYPVTNDEFAKVMNWAFKAGYLTDMDGNPYKQGVIYSHGKALADTTASSSLTRLEFKDGQFVTIAPTEAHNRVHSLGTHPVVRVSWHGACAYANFRSFMEDLPAFYRFEDWAPTEPASTGYRLPTEAEWERAAAWDVTLGKHWRYGFADDIITNARANCWLADYSNPLGLKSYPYTSPVGWYDGINPARPGGQATIKSVSPVGAYDMTGNVSEWCYDVYNAEYYASSPPHNPSGPESGKYRVLRGGSWSSNFRYCRTACRHGEQPEARSAYYGLRLCRSVE